MPTPPAPALPCRNAQPPAGWSALLPPELLAEVVWPTRGERHVDAGLPAERSVGYGADGAPSYCASRHRLAVPASDDDELFVDAAAFSECTTAWRLRDGRWLVHRSVWQLDRCPPVETARYFVADTMPR